MNCFSLEQMYLYLEQELSPAENKKIEEHLAICSKCQNALEERRLLTEAAVSLPSFEVPADFAQKIMSRISTKKRSIPGWLAVSLAGFTSLVLAFFIFALAVKQSLPSLLVRLNQSLLSYIQSTALFFTKFFKVLILFLNICDQILGDLSKVFSFLTALIPWEFPVIFLVVLLLIVFTWSLGGRRKFLTGEKP